MSEQSAPKIEFPCDYPVKVMGRAAPGLHSLVMEVMERHAPGFDETTVSVRDSRHGNFQSITVTITATGETQLAAIFEDLKHDPLVQMVL